MTDPDAPLSMDEALAWLRSEPVQELAGGRAHHITLVCDRSYEGKASVNEYGYRHIWLNVDGEPSFADLTLTLCHELAHYESDRMSHHDDQWRLAFAELVQEAGELGLFTEEQVEAGIEVALYGPRGAGFGWRERLAERESRKSKRDQTLLRPLLDAGLQVGSRVRVNFRGTRIVLEVERINRRSIRANSLDGACWYRFPFVAVEEVLDPQREA